MSDTRERERLLSALLDKYRTILRLRELPAAQSSTDARQAMQTLAARMPGSLRELQLLPIELVRSRLCALERVSAAAADPETWMLLQGAYHGLLRASLRIRRLLRASDGARAVEARLLGYVAAGDEPSPETFDAAALAVLLRPARGQLHQWVIERVAIQHAVAADEVRRALLPE